MALELCDMRKGFEGLCALVAERLREDLLSGALFAFGNRRRTRLKILYFDRTGLWLLTNRHAPQCAYWFDFENPLEPVTDFLEEMSVHCIYAFALDLGCEREDPGRPKIIRAM